MSLHKIKLVTFDATNTLLKFRVPPWQHYMVVARDHGFRGTELEVKHRLMDSFRYMSNKYPNFGKNKINWLTWWTQVVRLTFESQLPKTVDIDTIAERLIDEFRTPKCWCIADGAKSLLCLLCSRGYSVGVISNFDPRLFDILQSMGISKYFDFILTSYECGYSKPDEKIFKIALKRCPQQPKAIESLHIGDDFKNDYKGAKAAGWNALLITENLLINETPPAQHHVFTNLDKLSVAIECNKVNI